MRQVVAVQYPTELASLTKAFHSVYILWVQQRMSWY